MCDLKSSFRMIVVVSCLVSFGAFLSARTSPGDGVHSASKPAPEPTSYREVVKMVLPAVVSVESVTKPAAQIKGPSSRLRADEGLPPEFRKFFDGFFDSFELPETPQRGLGSGIIIDGQGVILTNYHVVKGASEVSIHTQDGRTFQSSDIKGDPKTDLAVIRVRTDTPLPHLEFGDSASIEIGDRVLAVGAPFGLAGSVSAGIVSAKGRRLDGSNYVDFLQTDAAINPGNSGGPLVNLDGKVIGISTAIRSNSGGFQGVGLAISSDVARDIVTKLVKEGVVRRGYLGIQIQQLSADIRSRLGVPSNAGVLVARTVPDGPAANAGMQSGDVIISVNGYPVNAPIELQRRVADLPLNRPATVTVVRDGKSIELTVNIEEQPDSREVAEGQPTSQYHRRSQNELQVENIGVEIADLTPELQRRFGLSPLTQGALITNVLPNQIAHKAGLRAGSVITKVNDTSAPNASEVKKLIESAKLEQGVLLQLRREDGSVSYVMLRTMNNG